jgi:hypothetical protein
MQGDFGYELPNKEVFTAKNKKNLRFVLQMQT